MQRNTAARLAAHVPLIFLTRRQMKEAQRQLLSVLTAPVMATARSAAGGAASTCIHKAVWSRVSSSLAGYQACLHRQLSSLPRLFLVQTEIV